MALFARRDTGFGMTFCGMILDPWSESLNLTIGKGGSKEGCTYNKMKCCYLCEFSLAGDYLSQCIYLDFLMLPGPRSISVLMKKMLIQKL